MASSGDLAAASEAHHELQQGVKLQPPFNPSPNLKPTKDGFDGSSSSIPSFTTSSPSSMNSFHSSFLTRSLSFPPTPYYSLSLSSAKPSQLGLQIPSSESFHSRWVRTLSFPNLHYKIPGLNNESPKPGELQIPSPAGYIPQGLIECWKSFLALPRRFYIKMRETDEEVEPEKIHPILWCIEKNELSKKMLMGIGMSMTAGLILSNSPQVTETAMTLAAYTLPITFTILLIGLLLRKTCQKSSHLFQLLGIGLGIFVLSASVYGFLTDEYKWLPVVTGLLCLIILVMPVPAIISCGRMISEEKKDLETGE